MPLERYFEGVEAIMGGYGGRPHWGKLHFLDAADLAPRYPQWDRFQAVRDRLDPDRRFANAHLERVLGALWGQTRSARTGFRARRSVSTFGA